MHRQGGSFMQIFPHPHPSRNGIPASPFPWAEKFSSLFYRGSTCGVCNCYAYCLWSYAESFRCLDHNMAILQTNSDIQYQALLQYSLLEDELASPGKGNGKKILEANQKLDKLIAAVRSLIRIKKIKHSTASCKLKSYDHRFNQPDFHSDKRNKTGRGRSAAEAYCTDNGNVTKMDGKIQSPVNKRYGISKQENQAAVTGPLSFY